MFQRIRTLGLAGTDVLGLGLALSVFASQALPGIAPAQLQTAFGTGSSQPTASERDHANCLWLAARDNGFYTIQHDAVTGAASDSDTALWLQFLDSTGKRECGSSRASASVLNEALSASLLEADRHFKATANVLYSSL